MNRVRIDRLLATVPLDLDAGHRREVEGSAAAARRCEERIGALRAELQNALRALGALSLNSAPEVDEGAAADRALRLVCELDALERAQPRIDSWLRVAIDAVTDHPGLEPFGEGPA